MIVRCRLCPNLFKRPSTIWMVYPADYDHSCCPSCNAQADGTYCAPVYLPYVHPQPVFTPLPYKPPFYGKQTWK